MIPTLLSFLSSIYLKSKKGDSPMPWRPWRTRKKVREKVGNKHVGNRWRGETAKVRVNKGQPQTFNILSLNHITERKYCHKQCSEEILWVPSSCRYHPQNILHFTQQPYFPLQAQPTLTLHRHHNRNLQQSLTPALTTHNRNNFLLHSWPH